MKQKTDETLDQWVRHSLSQLPDSPPPSSTFDAEQLWTQLRPELQAAPTRQKIGLTWWSVAACLAGLMISWVWLHQSIGDRKTIATHTIDRKVTIPTVGIHNLNSVAEVAGQKRVFIKKHRSISGMQIRSQHQVRPDDKAVLPRIETVDGEPPVNDLPVIAEVVPTVDKPTERTKSNVAATAPKRRFRVVHENELQAEEEARPKLYRTDHFVRIGTGERSELITSEKHPSLTLPLTHKSNQ